MPHLRCFRCHDTVVPLTLTSLVRPLWRALLQKGIKPLTMIFKTKGRMIQIRLKMQPNLESQIFGYQRVR